jgi:hypothetical protein
VSKPLQYIYSKNDPTNGDTADDPTNGDAPGPIKPEDILGRSILLEPDEDGQRLCANIVRQIDRMDEMTNKKIYEFLIDVPDDRMDQIREYHDLLAILDKQSFAQDGSSPLNS